MNTVFLSIGSNEGDRQAALLNALTCISGRTGTIMATSSIYQSESWGHTAPDYLNVCVELHTAIPPTDLLRALKRIEKEMGRRSSVGPRYSSRLIDIDILLYDDRIVDEKGLSIPHPRMQQRSFVLTPLSEIAAKVVHPIYQRSIGDMLVDCLDNSRIERLL